MVDLTLLCTHSLVLLPSSLEQNYSNYFAGDQIPDLKPRVKRNKKGELVVAERELSIQYVFNGYYW